MDGSLDIFRGITRMCTTTTMSEKKIVQPWIYSRENFLILHYKLMVNDQNFPSENYILLGVNYSTIYILWLNLFAEWNGLHSNIETGRSLFFQSQNRLDQIIHCEVRIAISMRS